MIIPANRQCVIDVNDLSSFDEILATYVMDWHKREDGWYDASGMMASGLDWSPSKNIGQLFQMMDIFLQKRNEVIVTKPCDDKDNRIISVEIIYVEKDGSIKTIMSRVSNDEINIAVVKAAVMAIMGYTYDY